MTDAGDKTKENLAVTRIAVASNSLLTVGKLVVGTLMGSTAVIAEAIHSGVDLVAAIIAFWAVRKARRPADADHAFGHGKYDALSGAIEGVLIFGAAAFIIYEAIRKLTVGGEVEKIGWGAAVMGVSALINYGVSWRLFAVAKRTGSTAVEADGHHLRTDVWTSVGVLVGLILIHFTGIKILDPICALAVALLILKAAWEITGKSFGELLDRRLPAADEKRIGEIVHDGHPHWIQYHELRTRRAGGVYHIDLHLVTCSDLHLDRAHALTDDLENDIRREFPGAVIVSHLEPCETSDEDCNDDCPLYIVKMTAHAAEGKN